MAKVKRSVLEPLVVAEATSIKKLALKRELKKLDFCNLAADDYQNCIYGQMTGDCFNERAYELIRKSCPSVIDSNSDGAFKGDLLDLKEHAKDNGVEKISEFDDTFRTSFYSPIEVFISRKRNRKNGNNAKLVAFLRGETDTLDFH
jgi:hypothetical protein